MSNRKTLRIACLHGYCQNSTVFRKKTGGLRKSLERSVNTVRAAVSYPALDTSDERDDGIPLAQLIYLDAPFVLEDKLLAAHSPPATRESDKFMTVFRPVVYAGNENGCSKEEDTTRRSWWAAEGDGKKYVGWEQSLQYIRDAFREQKFDGILGFSQGAIVTSLLCSLRNNTSTPIKELESLRFAIMMSGFPSRATTHQYLYNSLITVPSMHVWGLQDRMLPPIGPVALMEKFDERDRLRHVHPKGHMVPSDADFRMRVSRFFLRFYDELNESSSGEQPRAAL